MHIFELSFYGITLAPTWYGLAYAVGFAGGYGIILHRKRIDSSLLDPLLLAIFLGVILGGRLGYVLFYNSGYYFSHPAEILATWKGGMSFHGGLLGVILAAWIFSKIKKISFFQITDELALVLPIGIFLGRIANFANNELYGFSPYNGPFPMMVDGVAHFPSPLLEATLEGFVLAAILQSIVFLAKKHSRLAKPGILSGAFLVVYGIARIITEQFRLPDAQIGYIFGYFTLGELLSVPMLLVGIYILFFAYGLSSPHERA